MKLQNMVRNVVVAAGLFTSAIGYGAELEKCTKYDVNSNGKAEIAFCEIDRNGDGKTDFNVVLELDSKGRVTKKSIDYNGDKKIDRSVGFEYGIDGKVAREVRDNDGDGRTDEMLVNTYNLRSGRLAHVKVLDGKGDLITDYFVPKK